MRDLALQSANGSNSVGGRRALNSAVNEMKKEVDRIASTTREIAKLSKNQIMQQAGIAIMAQR